MEAGKNFSQLQCLCEGFLLNHGDLVLGITFKFNFLVRVFAYVKKTKPKPLSFS